MNLLPQHGSDFAKKDYWQDFFEKRKDPFEWYGTYFDLAYVLNRYIKKQDQILMVGCGNSELSDELYTKNDCKLITNIDISDNVITRMKKKAEENGHSMIYEVGDVTKMKYSDQNFNVVIDKGTLDAMMVDENEDTISLINKMFSEIERCIQNNGRYIVITLAQTHIANHIVTYFQKRPGWMIRLHEHTPVPKDDSIPLPVFIFCFTRMKPIGGRVFPKIMEIFKSNAEKSERVNTDEEMKLFIKSKQEWSQLKGHVQKLRPSGDEVNFKLFSDKVHGVPRFELFIIDSISSSNEMAFFIVQNGREFDWIYSTSLGRKSLAEQCKQIVPGGYKRLVIVLLNMLHEYGTLDEVKTELSWLVSELKSSSFKSSTVPFLTEGADLGSRNIIGKGESEFCGKYFIEESKSLDINGDEFIYRRLIYQRQPTIIQSECRLREEKIKQKKKKQPKIKISFDDDYVSSEYFFGILLCLETLTPSARVVVVGLGGGSLTTYISNKYKQAKITSIEIDQEMVSVAKKYFNFKTGPNSDVELKDGREISMENKVDLLILDVGGTDPSLSLQYPPESFVQPETLELWRRCLTDKGIIAVNLICREKEKQNEIIKRCRNCFKHCLVLRCDQDANKILVLSNEGVKDGLLKSGQTVKAQCGLSDSDTEKVYFMLSTMT